MVSLTPQQYANIKAAVNGDAALVTAWAARRYSEVQNALNLEDRPGDVDVNKMQALRTVVSRNLTGKLLARIEILKMQIQAVMQRAADLQASVGAAATAVAGVNISATETKLAALYNAWNLFSALDTIPFSDSATKSFVSATADAMIAEGVFVAGDKTAIMTLGTGMVSRSLIACGRAVSEGEIIEAMK